MGVKTVLGLEPLTVALTAVREDSARKQRSQRRVDLYLDDTEQLMRREIAEKFKEPVVRERLDPFLRAAGAQALFKRVINEIARPVYSSPPVRKVTPDRDQAAFDLIAEDCHLNQRMDEACRLGHACNSVWLLGRYSERLGAILDVLTPNMVTVIWDPEDPTRELALIYERCVSNYVSGSESATFVYWDDEVVFNFNKDGQLLQMPGKGIVYEHGMGRIPAVGIHTVPRWGRGWNMTSGNDLEGGQVGAELLTAQALKLHKSQGEKQIVVAGDIHGFPKDQVIDGEGALMAPDGTTITTLDLSTDPGHYLKTIEYLVTSVAANHGISRERLNQKADVSSDLGLNERREDAVKIFAVAEQEVFELLRLISREYPEENRRITDDARASVDFGEVGLRADPKGTLEIWKTMREMGLRNVLDDIRAMNPEIREESEAWEELDRNMEAEAEYIRRRRALNISEDADVAKPGQDPKRNGAMGPMVRDGQMTRDDAAQAAEDGPPPAEAQTPDY